MIESFEIDDDSLKGLCPKECFTLGVEWQMFLERIKSGEVGLFIVHAVNAPRIQSMGERHGIFCEWHPTLDIWAEIILGGKRGQQC